MGGLCVCPFYFFWRCVGIKDDAQINEQIRDKEVRLVSSEGEQLGIMPIDRALQLAEQQDLDLVKIAANAKPPVCKIMDYGKFRYEASRREKEARKNQKVITVKQVQLSATIDAHDMEVKAKQARGFLADGDKLKVVIRFRGRQMSYAASGAKIMELFLTYLEEGSYVIERVPKVEGRNMIMIVNPKEQ